MLLIFGILVLLSSIVLGLIVLVQNPKGGGLSGTFGGVGNQLMGVKQTTDVLEKGTWIFAAIVGILCIISPIFIKANGGASKNDDLMNKTQPAVPAKAAAPAAVLPGTKTDTPATK